MHKKKSVINGQTLSAFNKDGRSEEMKNEHTPKYHKELKTKTIEMF